MKYYAPVSHKTDKQQTNLRIFDNGIPLSTIKFSFMIPAFDEVLIYKNFKDVLKVDPPYASLTISTLISLTCIIYNINDTKNSRLY